MKKKMMLFLIGLVLIIPNRVQANFLVSYHSYGVTTEEKQLIAEEKQEENKPGRNIIAELKYRLFEKDTRDAVDYIILATLFSLMVLVIIALNKHSYVLVGNSDVFEREKVPDDDIKEKVIVEDSVLDIKEEKVEVES